MKYTVVFRYKNASNKLQKYCNVLSFVIANYSFVSEDGAADAERWHETQHLALRVVL